MSIARMRQLRPYPSFRLEDIPELEQQEARSIQFNVGRLHDWASKYWTGLSLFYMCAQRCVEDPPFQDIYREWQMTAARDCVMTIYHFGKTIEGIDTSFGKCLTLRDVIDTTQKREARKAFERAFPSYGDLRNAIAHSAERTNTTQMSHRHGKMGATTNDGQFSKVGVVDLLGTTLKITGEDPKFVVLEGMQGSTFITTWDGTMLACELTANAGQALDAVIDRYWEAFTVIINPPATHAPPSAESSPPSPRP